jgi:hypothetical protein
MPITKENLPYPIVLYPSGAFVSFKQGENDDIVFCSCMYEAIENHIKIRILDRNKQIMSNKERYERFRELNRESTFILNPWDFGGNIVETLIDQGVKEDESIINYIKFADKLCHECNQATPTPTFCQPMYGGKFKQKYGWYIRKKYYELGLNYNNLQVYLPDRCPQEIMEISDFRYTDLYADIKEYYPAEFEGLPHLEAFLKWCDIKYENTYPEINRKLLISNDGRHPYSLALDYFSSNHCMECNRLEYPIGGDFGGICKPNLGDNYNPPTFYGRDCFIYDVIIGKVISKRHRKINSIVENEVRQVFGVKNIGEAWTSESILYAIIKRVFPSHNVIRHYRPGILEGLELDIYIKEINVGIEYQGIQHFKPVKHWGGKEGLTKTKERDKRKADLCKLNNIHLIYFYHTENLSEELVIEKIGCNIFKD